MIIVLLGPPGSGKGTQAKKLCNEKKWPHLSTGDMLRGAISAGTPMGLEAKKWIDQGALVPDHVVVGLITERSRETDCQQGFILDGFPRNISQAETLDTLLSHDERKVDRVVLFEISDTFLVQRLTGRRTCGKCGAMYHIDHVRSRKEGICDQCGGSLIQRQDDTMEVIQNRLQVYHQQTEPLIAFYRRQSKLRSLDASQSTSQVTVSLKGLLV
jgi:adenylate kinase